jgi:YD repeat-containing protein
MFNKLFLTLCFFFSSFLLARAQSDSIIIQKCYYYEFGDVTDSSLSVDTFDVTTGLLRAEVSGDKMTRYSYNPFNLVDTSIYFNPLTDSAMRTVYLYTFFLKDSIILAQNYINSVWTNNQQTLYNYDSLQRLLTKIVQNWDISLWQTYSTDYYTYLGNNLDNILTLTIFPFTDSTLQVYIYDTLGNYNVNFYHWIGGSWDTLVNSKSFNAQGQIISSYDGWATWHYEYDSLGRLIVEDGTSPFQGGTWQNTNYNYSCSGWLHSTEYSYNSDQISRGTVCNYYYLGTSLIYVDLEPNHTICSGGTVHFNDSLILGVPPLSYSWSPSASLSSDTILNPDATPDSTTTYYLTATDSVGNIFTGCVTINVNPTPAISLIALDSTTICFGDSVHMLVSSNISSGNYYRWYRNSTNYFSGNDSISIVTQDGNYHVTVYTAAGCNSASDTVKVIVDNSALSSISVNTTHCIGDTATLSANPLNAPYRNYQWYLDSIQTNGATDSVIYTSTAGLYYLIVTCDTSVCVYNTNPVLLQFSSQTIPDIIPTTDSVICDGSGVVLSTIRDTNLSYTYYQNGTQYTWWSPSDSMTITITDSTYFYIVASNNGCSGYSDTILITTYPYFMFNILSIPSPPYCTGDTVVLSTSLPSSAGYQWSTGSVDSITLIDTSGYYYVYMTDTNGCFASSSLLLTFNPSPPPPSISQNGPELYSTAATSMQWYFNGIPIPGATANTYTPLMNGDYSYEITNSFGCSTMSQTYIFTTVNIYGNSASNEIVIYPQIIESSFEIDCQCATINKQMVFEIYSVTGEKIYSQRLFETITKIENSNIQDGIYFWKVTGADNNSGILQSGKIVFVN